MISVQGSYRTLLAKVARGEEFCDLCLKDVQVVNCINGKIEKCDVAIYGGFIAALGKGFKSKKEMDCRGLYLSPSFIDAHIHIESTMLLPREFARAVVPRGTGGVISDPHEIANCLGVKGVEFMLSASSNLPMAFYYTAPSCVPATHLETSGATLASNDVEEILKKEGIVALGEMMNFPGVILGDKEVHAKLDVARTLGFPIDGHSPGLLGNDLCAYVGAGIDSDHECTTVKEAEEKLSRGMYLFLREGTSEKNLLDLLPVVNEKTLPFCCLVSDDRHPDDLIDLGHMDYLLKTAVDGGLDPISALSMVTLNPARRFGLRQNGLVVPGFYADLVLLKDLSKFSVEATFFRGHMVAKGGALCVDLPHKEYDSSVIKAINVKGKLDFKIKAKGDRARVIGINKGQIVTEELVFPVKREGEFAISDLDRDILKIAVIERHHGTGNIAFGFVNGFGLKKGAIASTVAHDSHNIIVTGVDDVSMKIAVEALIDVGGGLSVSDAGGVKALLPLPVSGLMSMEPLLKVREQMDEILLAVKSIGCKIENPFMILSFLALPVIPKLKLTDKGIVDVEKFDYVSLFL